jgi:hypothetical protein
MQPPVLEGLGGPIQHPAGLLEGGHTVLGHDLFGDRAAAGGPGRRLGRLTRLGVLVLEQQPAKGDSDQGGDEKGDVDAPAVVAADGPQLRAGDRSKVLAWDEVAPGRPAATYQVVVTQRVHRRLRDAPPLAAGSVAGIIAVLRVEPTEASMSFRRRRLGDAGWDGEFGAAGGLLTYWVLQPERIVVVLDLTWVG